MDFPCFYDFFSTHGLNKLPQIWWVKPTLWSHRADTEHVEHVEHMKLSAAKRFLRPHRDALTSWKLVTASWKSFR